jgi:RHS repeat-associated protein
LAGIDFLPDGSNSPFDYSDEDVTFDYDNRGQLTAATYAGAALVDESYEYDENGNRDVVTNSNGTGASYTIGANNRLTNDGRYAYTYDDEGNRLTRTLNTGASDEYLTEYEWDHRNRLAKVTFKNNSGTVTKTVDHAYDAFYQWISRTVDVDGAQGSDPVERTIFVHDDGQMVLQFDGTGTSDLNGGNLSHRYLWGPAVDMLLADEAVDWSDTDADGEVQWALADQLGSVRDLVDSNGTLRKHTVYDGFGQRVSENYYDSSGNAVSSSHAEAVDQLFGYTGKPLDETTGLQNNWNRWYDAAVGTWTSEDIIWDGANKYAYVGNKTTTHVDPTGLSMLGKLRKLIDEGGHLFGRKLRNWQFRNRLVTLTDLETLTNVSKDTIDRLRKKYGDDLAVKFNACSQPDLSRFAQAPPVKVKGLTGDATADSRRAWAQLRKDNTELYKELDKRRDQLRFHHSNTDEMILIDKDLHEAFQHTGPASLLRNTTSGFIFGLLAPGLNDIREDINENPECAEDVSTWDLIGTGVVDVVRWFDPFIEDAFTYGPDMTRILEEKARREHEFMEKAQKEGIYVLPPGPKF